MQMLNISLGLKSVKRLEDRSCYNCNYYELDTPTEETVTEIDNYIQVEEGGTLTFESDDAAHMPVSSTDRFVVDLTSTTEETT